MRSESAATITSQCSVFAESEVITLLADGFDIKDIIAGIHRAIALWIISMVRKLGIIQEMTLTGGVAKNPGVIKFLEEGLGETQKLSVGPKLIGALGAAIIAAEKVQVHHV